MERDVWVSTQESLDDDETISAAYSFSVPYFYSGLTFAGKPTYVDCVDTFDVFNGDCRNVRICVRRGSTHVAITYDLLKGSFLVLSDETSELVEQYRRGDCNVIAGESVSLGKLPPDITEDMKFSNQIVSKEPLCIVTRNNDPEWSDLARLVVNTWILAEANNITQATAPLILDLFSKKKEDGSNQLLQSQMLSLVQEFGNHGELYEKYIQDLIPRDNGLNRPYNRSRTNGLLYSIPFGDLKGIGRDPIANGTLGKILVRGHLRCGVQPFRGAAFASESNGDMQQNNGTSMVWSGFDVDFCRAVAAAIFAGNGDKLTFVAFNEEADGYVLLADDSVDVVAGARVSLQADILAPELDHGVQFSLPYFYDNDSRESYALMTRQSDLQFPDFVYWIVVATIYAEEQGITSESSLQMPIQSFFGETFKQCFRDSISSVGSYGEIYNRTLQDFIPRTGANRLNDGQPGAQMFPISPV
jgi:ABC-type amino acid transport substrate-binding protein